MTASTTIKGLLAGLATVAIAGAAIAQSTPPSTTAKDPATGAGQQSTQTTPMGSTGTPGGTSSTTPSTAAGGSSTDTSTSGSTMGASGSSTTTTTESTTTQRTMRADRN